MAIERAATEPDEYDAIWPVVRAMRPYDEEARTVVFALLHGADGAFRRVGADLLGELCAPDEHRWGASIAEALVGLAEREGEDDVLWSVIVALGKAHDPIGGRSWPAWPPTRTRTSGSRSLIRCPAATTMVPTRASCCPRCSR